MIRNFYVEFDRYNARDTCDDYCDNQCHYQCEIVKQCPNMFSIALIILLMMCVCNVFLMDTKHVNIYLLILVGLNPFLMMKNEC